jgi:hypothetical protein
VSARTVVISGVSWCAFGDLHPGANEMTIPDYQIVMLPVLQFATRGETGVRELHRRPRGQARANRGGAPRIRQVILMKVGSLE